MMQDFTLTGTTLGVPFAETTEYLKAPRHWRWLTYAAGAAAWVRIHVQWAQDSRPVSERTLITASQVKRLKECSGGASLLKVEDVDDQEAASAGTEIHRKVLMDEATREADQEGRLLHFLWSWLHKDGGQSHVEVARGYRVDGTVGNYGTLAVHRDYPAEVLIGATEDAGSVSVHPPSGGDADQSALFVIRTADLKTGHAQLYAGALELPGEAEQLKTNAVLRWVELGRPQRVRVHMAWACWDDEESYGWIDEAPRTFGAEDLASWEADLLALWRNVDDGRGRGSFARGPHCTYCSSLEFCPAQRGAIVRLRDQSDSVKPTDEAEIFKSMSDEEIGSYWADLLAAEEIVGRARRALTTIVERAGAIPSGGGKELIPARNLPRKFKADADKMRALAEEHVVAKIGDPGRASAAADLVVKRTVTLKSVTDALTKVGLDPETFLAELEESGVVYRQATRPFIRERKIRRLKPAQTTMARAALSPPRRGDD